jgi:DNA-binding transcriptional MerR regulator
MGAAQASYARSRAGFGRLPEVSYMKAGELAGKTGVSARALRYYEERGLLHPQRAASGRRIYDEQDVDRVRFFQLMYAAGLNSNIIAALLPCIDTGHSNDENLRMLLERRQQICGQVEDLQTALQHLDTLIASANRRLAESLPEPVAEVRTSTLECDVSGRS